MRVLITTSQQQQNNDSLKPNISVLAAAAAIPVGNNHHLSLCSYEPTSVLDLRSPVTSSNLKPPPASLDLTSTTLPQSYHGWGDGDSHHHALQSLDWDSIMKDLDLHDDSFAHVPTSNYGSFELGGEWFPTPKRPPEVAVMVVWFQTYRGDPYSIAKITENKVSLELVSQNGMLTPPNRLESLVRDMGRFGGRAANLWPRLHFYGLRRLLWVSTTSMVGSGSLTNSPGHYRVFFFPFEY
ncbi:hypothetical protein CRG98_030568 [Punica granatum]|uniref:Uncharacterized protein n=1 Tax=Punica granatum TaxID=22663 RepID=A0A2I0IYC3_PUNGR|nr:hypothetical protein CRG98_030568 [Punica granatum]